MNEHAPYFLKEERIKAGEEQLGRLLDEHIPKGSVTLSAEEAGIIRKALAESLYWGMGRGALSVDDKPHSFGYVSTGIQFTADDMMVLAKVFGMPHITMTDHGSCKNCEFGPKDRGWGYPCVSCGMGRPCFMEKADD